MKLKIGTKLGLGFAVVLILMIASAAISHTRLLVIEQRADFITEIRIPTIEHMRTLMDRLDFSGNKARHAILAGTEPARREQAQAAFDGAWSGIDKEVAVLTELSPRWPNQANRDRLAQIKEDLPKIQSMQRELIKAAASGGRDAIFKAGDDYADNVTPVADAVVKTENEMAEFFDEAVKREKVELDAAKRATMLSLWLSTGIAVVVGLIVSILLAKRISGAAGAVLKHAEGIAAGDLSAEELHVASEDELGELTRAINRMQVSLREIIESIAENAQNVANASEEFSAVSQQISANSEETSAQVNVVSNATEQVNRGLQTVATATEQMSVSIQEIAKNATEAAKVAANATKTAQETNLIVSKLGESSAEIGQVIKVITSIAQKTDLLALNATVEAARAGEVGAGFAVVANEVKELAKQTATATEDISRKIEAIQSDAKSAVTAIGSISSVIGQVNDISGTIATAVEEQSATTSEMSRNVTEAARGSGEVAQNIQGVAQAAHSTSQGATDSQKASKGLAEMATRLRELVGRFKLDDNGRGTARPSGRSDARTGRPTAQREYEEELAAR
jgi:methyl-accepting chemotaxis protein